MIRQSERKNPVYCNLGSAYFSVCCNPGAAVVFHTPKACSHLALGSYWNVKRRAFLRDPAMTVPRENNLFVTGISDKEAIFGGEEILRQCLLDVSEMPGVEYIVVVPGCTAGVIGDDVESVAKEIESLTGIPIIVVPGAGFMSGHYVENNIRMLETFIKRFTIDGFKQKSYGIPKTALIIGENLGAGNEHDGPEYKRLLGYFGFEKIICPPNATTKEEFALIPHAELIIPVGISRDYFGKMQAYGEDLAKRYGAKCYLGNYPVGIEGTQRWLQEIGALLGCSASAVRACTQERIRVGQVIAKHYDKLQKKRYVLVIGYPIRYFDAENHIKTLAAAGLSLQSVILHNDLTQQEKAAHRARLAEFSAVSCFTEEDLKDQLATVDFVLTTTELLHVPHQLCLSLHQLGTWGAINLINKALAAINGSGRRLLYEY